MPIPDNAFKWSGTNGQFYFCTVLWASAEVYQSYVGGNTWAVVTSFGKPKMGFSTKEKAIAHAQKKISKYLEEKYKSTKVTLDAFKDIEHYFLNEIKK